MKKVSSIQRACKRNVDQDRRALRERERERERKARTTQCSDWFEEFFQSSLV